MNKMSFIVVCCFTVFVGLSEYVECGLPVLTQPEQVHLSYGDNEHEMIVTWVTQNATSASVVEYGPVMLNAVAKGNQVKFVDGGPLKRAIYVHKVTLANLSPGQKYWYHCGGPDGWSDLFFFTAMKKGNNWSPRLALYGDMGNVNAQSLTRLQEETQRGLYDAIFHVGDFAYNMDVNNGKVGDAFMRQIQPIAAYVPYMTTVGNHENKYVNVGPVHFIMFSSEMYYFMQYGWKQIEAQYHWLVNDLQEANAPQNRSVRPWIITMCHRPMYCTNQHDDEHCKNINNFIRVGVPLHNKLQYGVEELLYKYGVDIHVQAHEHSYERMWPVYNRTVCNGSKDAPYTNPQAPVHIVTGSAGCQERVDPFIYSYPWSAFRSDDYGYTRMNVINSTHIHLEQVSDDKGGAVIDKILVVKEKHGAGTYSCHKK